MAVNGGLHNDCVCCNVMNALVHQNWGYENIFIGAGVLYVVFRFNSEG